MLNLGANFSFLWSCFILTHAARALAEELITPIRVVTIIVGDSWISGREVTEFAYNYGLVHAEKIFPRIFKNFSRQHFYVPGNFSCVLAAAETTVLMGQVYDGQTLETVSRADHSVTVILTPGCSAEVLTIGDFSREWNTTVLASTAVDRQFVNKVRFPTVVTTGCSTFYSSATAIVAFMKNLSFTAITMICDKRSNDVVGAALIMACNALVERLSTAKIDLLPLFIDSNINPYDNYEREVLLARKHGLVESDEGNFLTLFFHGELLQKMREAFANHYFDHVNNRRKAKTRNKSRGFRSAYKAIQLPLYRIRWSDADEATQKAALLLPHCINVRADSEGQDVLLRLWANTSETGGGIVNEYIRKAPDSYKINKIQIAAYETVLLMAQVLNESYDDLHTVGTGPEFAKRFRNRSFNVLNHRVNLSASGTRLNNIMWYFDVRTMKLEDISGGGARFIEAITSIFDDHCEFGSEGCATYKRLFALVSVAFFALVAIGCALAYRYRRLAYKASSWWFIESTSLTDEIVGSTLNCGIFIAGYNVDHLLTDKSLSLMITMDVNYKNVIVGIIRTEIVMNINTMLRKPKSLAVLKMASGWIAELDVKRGAELVLCWCHYFVLLTFFYSLKLRCLDHPNLAKFYGLSVDHISAKQSQLVLVVESFKKGLLRNMIDDGSLTFGWDLRFSLISDIFKGLSYLHSTPLLCHGRLCFLNICIDNHLTLKISHCGLHLLQNSFLDHKTLVTLPLFLCLWFAPEVINNPQTGMTQSGDVYSLGVVLFEIITRSTPFDVDVTNISQIKETVDRIKMGKLEVDAYLPSNVSPSLNKLVMNCLSPSPEKRPTMAIVNRTLIKLNPRSNVSFTENLINRLQDYSEELEKSVHFRTLALQAETVKVDSLLSNLLPLSIVIRLRNKDGIVPEFFESVTILFSAIPSFSEIVAICSPFSVMQLLQHLYSLLDEIILQFDVYKVETVKDSYMVASGLPLQNGDQHATEIARLSLDMLQCACVIQTPPEHASQSLKLRIGISTGSCVAAVIGHKLPHYCLVGDTVNTASRMETSGEELKVHISLSSKLLLDTTKEFRVEPRGQMDIKGKGKMATYWLHKYNVSV